MYNKKYDNLKSHEVLKYTMLQIPWLDYPSKDGETGESVVATVVQPKSKPLFPTTRQ